MKNRQTSSIINLRVFHNWVKSDLFQNVSNKLKNEYDVDKIRILELAVGKAGDLFKWKSIEAYEVVGVDISSESVFGKNGAYERHRKLQNQKGIPRCWFYVMDLSMPESFKKLKEILQNKKFSIISCQFAVHYFFEKPEAFKNIVKIIDYFLEENGYFIGTTLNLEAVNKLISLEGNPVNKELYSIEKINTDSETETNTAYGNKIHVSLGKKDEDHYFGQNISVEYLTNSTEMTTQLKEIGLNKIDDKMFKKYYTKFKKSNKFKKLSKEEQEYSFLNYSFSYQRMNKPKINKHKKKNLN